MYNGNRGSNNEIDIGKNGPAKAIFDQSNYIKGGRAPQKNLPRNKHSQSFNYEKHLDDYPDFMKIDRRCISHDMISLMNDYDILRGINESDISIDDLQLLLSLSTHIRKKNSKFSHTNTGKIYRSIRDTGATRLVQTRSLTEQQQQQQHYDSFWRKRRSEC
jgi:hypothetical protein